MSDQFNLLPEVNSLSFAFPLFLVAEPAVVQGKCSERRWDIKFKPARLTHQLEYLGSPSEGAPAQREHQPPAGQARAAAPPDQHHQPGAQTCIPTAADPHQAGRCVQGEREELQDQEVPPENAPCRSGDRPGFIVLFLRCKQSNITSKEKSNTTRGNPQGIVLLTPLRQFDCFSYKLLYRFVLLAITNDESINIQIK